MTGVVVVKKVFQQGSVTICLFWSLINRISNQFLFNIFSKLSNSFLLISLIQFFSWGKMYFISLTSKKIPFQWPKSVIHPCISPNDFSTVHKILISNVQAFWASRYFYKFLRILEGDFIHILRTFDRRCHYQKGFHKTRTGDLLPW